MENFQETDYSQTVKSPWKKIIKTILRDKKGSIGLLVSVFILSLLDIAMPIINRYAIQNYFESTDPNRFSSIGYYIGFYIGFALIYGLCVFVFLYFAGRIETRTAYELRKEAYHNLQQLPFSYFDRTPQGWIMARMTSDARRLSNILSWGLVDLLWGIFTMIGTVIILMFFSIELSIIILILIPILLSFTIIIRRKILKHYREARKINSTITAAYNEGFMGSKTTKSLVIEKQNCEEFKEKVIDYRRHVLKAIFTSSFLGPVVFMLGYMGVAFILYFGGMMSLSDTFGSIITVSLLYLFVDYTIKFFEPVMNISRVIGDFQQAQASAERIISLIEQDAEIKDTPEVIEKYGTIFTPKKENWEDLKGDIEFNNVSFKYNVGEQVLTDFNLKIKAGSNVALVGHTGSGKSTIVNLICRFYEPTAGEILIDGINYKKRSLGWLHSNLGYVLQTPQLFSGSIIDNIRYGRLSASDNECIEAAKIVEADEFISKLDNGYYSNVGESGNRLSLGEKQLISFARAIVADPKILVLDEATSSIDTKTEDKIQHAIDVVLKGRTSFMIAHRLSTVVNADLILVMQDGKVVESGRHSELLRQKGYYFELYKNQFQKELEDKIIN